MKVSDTYQEPILIESSNCIIRVYRPILSPEERERRMKRIHDAAAEVIKAKMNC